jgi:general stress protein 26
MRRLGAPLDGTAGASGGFIGDTPPGETAMAETDQDARQKVLELVRDAKIAMMATRNSDGVMHARPMATQTAEFDGSLWFLTDIESPKVTEIDADNEVLVTYSDESKQNYVSVSGKGRVLRDQGKIDELWSEAFRTWFPKGKDDPSIALIRVDVDTVQYWDSPSSTMLYAYGYLKALATGERPDAGEVRTVRF